MMPLSRCGAKAKVLAKEMMDMRRQTAGPPGMHKPEMLIRPMTAIMIIAASTDWGR